MFVALPKVFFAIFDNYVKLKLYHSQVHVPTKIINNHNLMQGTLPTVQ